MDAIQIVLEGIERFVSAFRRPTPTRQYNSEDRKIRNLIGHRDNILGQLTNAINAAVNKHGLKDVRCLPAGREMRVHPTGRIELLDLTRKYWTDMYHVPVYVTIDMNRGANVITVVYTGWDEKAGFPNFDSRLEKSFDKSGDERQLAVENIFSKVQIFAEDHR